MFQAGFPCREMPYGKKLKQSQIKGVDLKPPVAGERDLKAHSKPKISDSSPLCLVYSVAHFTTQLDKI